MNYFLKPVTLLFIFYLITACSSSTQTIRYGKQNERPVESEIETIPSDTLTINEEDEIAEYLDPGDIPEETNEYNITDIMKNLESNPDLSASQTTLREKLLMEIIKYLETPYKFGGNTLNGIDCSAFTQSVYRDALNINLNRTAREQFKQGKVVDKDELEFGDLVFFNTRRRVRPGHVGIYIGDGLFAHASTKNGVTISSLGENYYSKRYMGARRVVEEDIF